MFDDRHHVVTEVATNFFPKPFDGDLFARVFSRVLECVVKKGADRLIFVTSKLEHERSHPENVRDIRRCGPFTRLLAMHPVREGKGPIEPF